MDAPAEPAPAPATAPPRKRKKSRSRVPSVGRKSFSLRSGRSGTTPVGQDRQVSAVGTPAAQTQQQIAAVNAKLREAKLRASRLKQARVKLGLQAIQQALVARGLDKASVVDQLQAGAGSSDRIPSPINLDNAAEVRATIRSGWLAPSG